MEQDLPLKYPRKEVILWHSFISMAAGWLAQFIIILLFVIGLSLRDLVSDGNMIFRELKGLTFFWAIYSGAIILIAWIIAYVPVYFILYSNEKYYAKRWRFTSLGVLTGFLIPFGLMFFWYWIFNGKTYEWELLYLAALATICGGTAAEVGYRLRRNTLKKLNNGRGTTHTPQGGVL